MANKDELVKAARNPWWQAAAAVAAIALVLTFALGGFKQAKSVTKPLPQYPAGHRFQGGAMAVTPLRAWVARYKPGGQIDSFNPDKQYLVLQADIENLTPRSFGGLTYPIKDLILVSKGGEPVLADTVLIADDHTIASDLHPRLKQRVDLVWPLPKDYAHSPQATFGVFARDYKAKAYLNDEGAWMQGNPAAKFKIPVQDLRNRMVAP
ncbi:hypothetical protein [Pseudomonas sp. CGJS7]|uniref:hypothetical protein n=1 Tax=Pseudomonas sp. CGJS7 TaxID=3109348 RepID=UPI003009FD24